MSNVDQVIPLACCTPSLKDEKDSLKPIDDNEIIVTRTPVFASGLVLINWWNWKQLIINTDVSALYLSSEINTIKIPDHSQHTTVLSLSPWNEFKIYNTPNYSTNVQLAGKAFIHFPLTENYKCNHGYVSKSVCNQGACGLYSPFLDMKAITSVPPINEYMDRTGNGILLHCHNNSDRMLLFIGCCMIQGKIPVDEVLNIMETLELPPLCQLYMTAFAEYLTD